jgi:hypothetical protein
MLAMEGTPRALTAELTDAQLRALSGHRTAAMVHVYAKQTMKQRRAGARKRRDERLKAAAAAQPPAEEQLSLNLS